MKMLLAKGNGQLGFRAFGSYSSDGIKVATFWQHFAVSAIDPTRGFQLGLPWTVTLRDEESKKCGCKILSLGAWCLRSKI